MRYGLLGFVVLFAWGCGNNQDNVVDNRTPSNVSQRSLSNKEVKYVPAQLRAESKDLNLLSSSTYNAVITGCLSGYSLSLDQTHATAQVQSGDLNCEFKLTQIVIGGETFIPAGTQDWSAGQSFNITGSNGTKMSFNVIVQLDSPIIGPQSVVIQYGAAQQGIQQNAAADVETGISIEGLDPISLSAVNLDVSVDPSDGAGRFLLKLECDFTVVGSGAGAVCDTHTMSSIKFGLVKLPPATGTIFPTIDQCRDVANGTMTGSFGGLTGTVLNPGADPEAPNGGLVSADLKGPAALYTPANAELALAMSEGNSDSGCKFFRITVQQP